MALASPPPVARGLLVGTAAVWLVLEARQTTRTRPEAKKADRGSRPIIRVALAVGVVAAVVAAHVAPGATIGSVAAAAWIGLIVFWCGVALRVWSFRTLGRYFTFTVQTSRDQPVVTDGPYRFVRHPSYTGILLAVVGLGLYIGNWLSVVCLTVAVACGLVYRIRVEERALLAELGDRYWSFAATRKRLVPFIW